jgi:hypothetical protein
MFAAGAPAEQLAGAMASPDLPITSSAPHVPGRADPPPEVLAVGGPSAPVSVRPPAGSPLASPIIKRDCGFSVELTGGDALWIFCDSTDADAGGSFSYFRESTAAFARADDPYTMREATNSGGEPYTFIEPVDEYDPCTGAHAGELHVIWPSSATRVPGPMSTDRVIVFFENLCYEIGAGIGGFTPMSMGVAEWIHDPKGPDPDDGPIQARTLDPNLFPEQAPFGGWGEAAVYAADGYLYLYRCSNPAGCQVGRVLHGYAGVEDAYRFWTGVGWSTDPGDAVTIDLASAPPPLAFNVVYLPEWNVYAMTSMRAPGAYTADVEVRVARTPTGPFGPVETFTNTTDCSDGPKCYSGYLHTQLSDVDTLALGVYDWQHYHLRGGQVRVFTNQVELVPPPPGICYSGFSDVDHDHLFCKEIAWFAAEGITTGWPDQTFRPRNDTTRQVMAAWFYRWAGSPPGPFPDPGFPDVTPENPFYQEISWFVELGLAEGYDDGRYHPAATTTRQSMAAFFHRAAGSPPGPFPDPGFPDVTPDNPFYQEIAWFADQGITLGGIDGLFRPRQEVSRQVMAAFFYRYAGN